MAEDIKIIWNEDFQEGDINFDGGDLERENGLRTAVLMSLYTDRQANEDDELPDSNSDDRRGWWGDQIDLDFKGDKIGSRLWLLERGKTDDSTLAAAKFYIEECLEWMLDDEVAQAIDVEVERQKRRDGTSTLAANIAIRQSDGGVVALKFNDLWNAELLEE